jgi:hypothetical protein
VCVNVCVCWRDTGIVMKEVTSILFERFLVEDVNEGFVFCIIQKLFGENYKSWPSYDMEFEKEDQRNNNMLNL